MAELLFEILTEEAPARFQQQAEERFKRCAEKLLQDANVPFETLAVYTTPRRMTLVAEGLPTQLPATTVKLKGPNIKAPETALQGFLHKTQLTQADLTQEIIGKHTFWMTTQHKEAQDVAPLLTQQLETLLKTFDWPQTMAWGAGHKETGDNEEAQYFKWVRPIRNLLALFDQKKLPVRLENGDQSLESTNKTTGHRFMGDATPFAVTHFADYEAKLKAHYVVLRRNERKAIIEKELRALGDEGLCVQALDLGPGGLIDEVVGLCEWPVVLKAPLSQATTKLPPAVPLTVLRYHMKAFVLYDAKGALQPFFAFVANIHAKDNGQAIINGLTIVANARLEDAVYFVTQDLKKGLKTQRAHLTKRLFFQGLGTLYQKTQRLEDLAKTLWPNEKSLHLAARFAKADLTSDMVGEFPELQGYMGATYATKEGLDAPAASAIRDHYWPFSTFETQTEGARPSDEALKLALLDRLDSLYGFFALGMRPSGSKDPMALRRLGNAVITTLCTLKAPSFDLTQALQKVGALYHAQAHAFKEAPDAILKNVVTFLEERSAFVLKTHLQIEAPLIAFAMETRLFEANALFAKIGYVRNLHHKLQDTAFCDAFHKAAQAFKRIQHILDSLEKRPPHPLATVDETLFEHNAEKALWQALQPLLARPLSDVLLSSLLALALPIDSFFEDVMIMTKDLQKQHNRIVLLEHVVAFAHAFGHWGKVA